MCKTPLNLGSRAKAVMFASLALLSFVTPARSQGLTQYTPPTANSGLTSIVAGPDGAMWFTESAARKIGRITTSGVITEYALPAALSATKITLGPDGALWFSSGTQIGRMTTQGAITSFPITGPQTRSSDDIVTGSDGALWFTNHYAIQNDLGCGGSVREWIAISRMTLNGTVNHFDTDGVCSGFGATLGFGGLARGGDDAVWFTKYACSTSGCPLNTVGRIDPSGNRAEFAEPSGNYPTGRALSGIAKGADGAMWWLGSPQSVGACAISRMATLGAVARYPSDLACMGSITSGPDGALWFTSGGTVNQMTLAGNISTMAGLNPAAVPQLDSIVTGPDGALWSVDTRNNTIVRVTSSASLPNQNTHDIDGNGRSDILWLSPDNRQLAIWFMDGIGATSTQVAGYSGAGVRIVGQRNFNSDGKADLLWRGDSGVVLMWLFNGIEPTQKNLGVVTTDWTVVGLGDFNADGRGDILWRHSSGRLAFWQMNAETVVAIRDFGLVDPSWSIARVADLNGDGSSDIIWRHANGDLAIWLIDANGNVQANIAAGNVSNVWSIVGVADFNHDGKTDILWRHDDGTVAIWLMNGGAPIAVSVAGNVATHWSVQQTGDYNGDGYGDILWRNTDGVLAMWVNQAGSGPAFSVSSLGAVSNVWAVQGINAD